MKALIGQVQVELALFLRDKAVVFFSLFFPLVTVGFFGYLNQESQVGQISYPSFLIAGGIGMVVSSAAFENLSTALTRQRDTGILKRLGGTPLRTWTLIGAKILTAATVTLAQTIVLVVGILTFATMGIALAGICPNADVASAAGMAISLPMQFLCGTLFPIEEMPPLLQRIAQVLPLTYFVDALRGAMLVGGGPAAYAKDWIILLGCLAMAFVVAVKTFKWE
jgi:ABC-2 type transport system permease protein